MEENRIIGKYEGQRRGPMLICLGGAHGNEPAGVEAISILYTLLKEEPDNNPDFIFSGLFLGLRGNTKALKVKERYLEKDFNRLWEDEAVCRYLATPSQNLGPEEQEIKAIVSLIHEEVERYQPDEIVFLDLHTTTAHGGIFSIPTEDSESLRIAVELHAPVINGMLQGMKGTTLHYFKSSNFKGRKVTAVAFESGQHDDPLSTNRAIAAIINCMRTIGCVIAEQVENRHDELLIEYSADLPRVSNFLMCHNIKEEDEFQMLPNFKNFESIQKGQLLARDKNGPIYSPFSGRILMPLYQQRGDDGFFIIREVNLLDDGLEHLN